MFQAISGLLMIFVYWCPISLSERGLNSTVSYRFFYQIRACSRIATAFCNFLLLFIWVEICSWRPGQRCYISVHEALIKLLQRFHFYKSCKVDMKHCDCLYGHYKGFVKTT